jgi:hypothetical protein
MRLINDFQDRQEVLIDFERIRLELEIDSKQKI